MLLVILGAIMVAVTMIDFVWTTLSVKGAGPLTLFSSRRIWAFFGLLARSLDHRWPLLIAGPTIILSALLLWFILLWIAWTLIFCSASEALVTSHGGVEAGFWSRVHFVGFTLTTLGVGDITPNGAPWQVLTTLVALNGMTVVTMTISYLLGVLSAVTALRACASHISALGTSPSEFLTTGWDGSSFAPLCQHLMALTPTLHQLTQSTLAYPVLLFFGAERRAAIAPSLVVLDEALSVMQHGVAPTARVALGYIMPLCNAIDEMMNEVSTRPRRNADDGVAHDPSAGEDATRAPRAPSLAALRDAGVATDDDAAFDEALADRAGHRRRLSELLQDQGWDWRAVEDNPNRHGSK